MTLIKPKEKLSATETLRILDSQWLSRYEVMQVAFCCDSDAARHMKNIRERIEENGKFLPSKRYVPTAEVIDYFNINIAQLKRMSREKNYEKN